MSNSRTLALVFMVLLMATGCRPAGPVEFIATTVPATETPPAPTAPAPTAPAPETTDPLPTLAAVPAATRVGVDYVMLLPREAAVPDGWAMNPTVNYDTRQPQPGETYHFACRDLTARSIGAASVGYRSLEGLPSIHIEYVVYPTAELAAAALADMQSAVEACPEFTIGEGDGATSATFSPLDFPAYGDAGFATALNTSSPVTGELQIHAIKIRNGHVVIGINHTTYAGEAPPDRALTESLAALAVGNLDNGPAAPGE